MNGAAAARSASVRSAHRSRPLWLGIAGLALAGAGLAGPFALGLNATGWQAGGPALALCIVTALALAWLGRTWSVALVTPVALAATFLAIFAQRQLPDAGAWGYYAVLWGSLWATTVAVGRISLAPEDADAGPWLRRLQRFLPAATVPFLLLLLWEGLVVGSRVPKGIFPRVSDIGATLASAWPVLLADSYVTFVKEVLLGLLLGLATGYAVGAAIAFSRFLRSGFLPLAAAFGAVPIVGLAPVLGRAFGVDWESKTAVVVIVTFFPVVLNTVQGLTSVDPLRLELLRSYAATPRQIFAKLRIPNALPFIFNALKISVVVSIVSVIVAEFLIPGPPNGLGQRISLSAHRGAFDVVFAAILVSSLISMALYGIVLALERLLSQWHPSSRGS